MSLNWRWICEWIFCLLVCLLLSRLFLFFYTISPTFYLSTPLPIYLFNYHTRLTFILVSPTCFTSLPVYSSTRLHASSLRLSICIWKSIQYESKGIFFYFYSIDGEKQILLWSLGNKLRSYFFWWYARLEAYQVMWIKYDPGADLWVWPLLNFPELWLRSCCGRSASNGVHFHKGRCMVCIVWGKVCVCRGEIWGCFITVKKMQDHKIKGK